MQGNGDLVLTPDGYARLEAELERLRTVRRQAVADRLHQAGEFAGDLGDNLEYLDALREQEEIENRIARLESQLAAATVRKPSRRGGNDVSLGSSVELEDVDTGEQTRYRLVASPESDPAHGQLSIESPVGRTIAGHHTGEIVDVITPRGTRHLRILSTTG